MKEMTQEKNNPTQYNMRELQLRSVPILQAIDNVCRQHGLRYYMIYGTLLGAVRHGGFIPWDDDMDIGLLRDDYNQLMEHGNEWLPEPFHIVNYQNNEEYPKYFAKVEDTSTTLIENFALGYVGGIYIDIFPLDSVPNNRCLRTIQHYRFNICKRLLYLSYRNPYKHGHGPSSWAPLLVQKLFKRAQLHRLVQRVEYWWEGRSHCDYLTTYDDGLRVFPRHIFEEPVRMKFEGVEANAPADSKAFLQIMYGDDYMTPPPEGKRLSHRHDYCDFDTPYADYFSSQSKNISKS